MQSSFMFSDLQLKKERQTEYRLKHRIRICIWVMIIGLALSGITAFPLQTELKWLAQNSGRYPETLGNWLVTIHRAIQVTNQNFPYLSYGTDWLAFAHIMLAILFFGTLKDPVKNIWVIEFGMIACISIIPLALIAGSIRHIPFFWRLVDCSFCIVGIIPLALSYKYIRSLTALTPKS